MVCAWIKNTMWAEMSTDLQVSGWNSFNSLKNSESANLSRISQLSQILRESPAIVTPRELIYYSLQTWKEGNYLTRRKKRDFTSVSSGSLWVQNPRGFWECSPIFHHIFYRPSTDTSPKEEHRVNFTGLREALCPSGLCVGGKQCPLSGSEESQHSLYLRTSEIQMTSNADRCWKPASTKLVCSRVGAGGLELLNWSKRDIEETRDRNIEQHQEGISVNTDFASFIFHTLIYFTPKGEGVGNRLH